LKGQVCPNLTALSLRDCPKIVDGFLERVKWQVIIHSRPSGDFFFSPPVDSTNVPQLASFALLSRNKTEPNF